MNEIDKLAELFIADCHEKFKLEKQDSDRRFHEMMARGMWISQTVLTMVYQRGLVK